jgi:hypothetical protein
MLSLTTVGGRACVRADASVLFDSCVGLDLVLQVGAHLAEAFALSAADTGTLGAEVRAWSRGRDTALVPTGFS